MISRVSDPNLVIGFSFLQKHGKQVADYLGLGDITFIMTVFLHQKELFKLLYSIDLFFLARCERAL